MADVRPLPSPRRSLILGGGIAGMSLALLLERDGQQVQLIEADPQWRVYGAGISITGPTFRAFKRLGLLPELRDGGYFIEHGPRICTPTGDIVADLPSHPIEPDLPDAGGIMRPQLHEILSRAVRRSAVEVRLGVTATVLETDEEGVSAKFSDGTAGRYDFAVGADGVFSGTRRLLFPDAPQPTYTGQYCWRIVADRPAHIDRPHFYMAGPITAGLMPVSDDRMYMWLLEPRVEKGWLTDDELAPRLRSIMAGFGGDLATLRDELKDGDEINARPLEAVLLPRPWHRGRMLLIGDAAHATTPHLASGAGLAVEDALVLAEELAADDDIETAFRRFEERRFERCRLVVENSVAIGRMQQDDASPEALKALMQSSQAALVAGI